MYVYIKRSTHEHWNMLFTHKYLQKLHHSSPTTQPDLMTTCSASINHSILTLCWWCLTAIFNIHYKTFLTPKHMFKKTSKIKYHSLYLPTLKCVVCFFFSSAIKSLQVEDCCMCRWFGEASIFVSGALMQTFHTGTLHEQRRHIRGGGGGVPESNKGLCSGWSLRTSTPVRMQWEWNYTWLHCLR